MSWSTICTISQKERCSREDRGHRNQLTIPRRKLCAVIVLVTYITATITMRRLAQGYYKLSKYENGLHRVLAYMIKNKTVTGHTRTTSRGMYLLLTITNHWVTQEALKIGKRTIPSSSYEEELNSSSYHCLIDDSQWDGHVHDTLTRTLTKTICWCID